MPFFAGIEVRELFTGELRSVVTHELLRNSMMCEQRTKMLNSLLGGGRIHLQDFGPLAVGVDDDEPHVRQEGSREVDVDPLPRASSCHSHGCSGALAGW